jgi:signal transduction histidine kinase/ActR/RegA family two-component response regulator
MPLPERTPDWPFLRGGGFMAEMIATHDWGQTSMGALAQWPAHVRDAMSLMLRTQVPMAMRWGEDGVLTYNDAYANFARHRHPALLGSTVHQGWDEVATFAAHVLKVCLAGGSLSYEDHELVLRRDPDGEAGPVWVNLDYSALLDPEGRPVGAMAVVVETTRRVQAERAVRHERANLQRLFDHAPSFMAMLQGPSHIFTMANPSYLSLVGHRALLGRTFAEALPDAVAQGQLALLDQVVRSGRPYHAQTLHYAVRMAQDGPAQDRYIDLVLQPMRAADGVVTGIFLQGVDVTARTLTARRTDALMRLADALRTMQETETTGAVTARIVGEALQAQRSGYGRIDAQAGLWRGDTVWTAPGVAPMDGLLPLDHDFLCAAEAGSGQLLAVSDVRNDPRVAARAARLQAQGVGALVLLPVVEHGRLQALLVVQHDHAHAWSAGELAFIREAAERARTAAERVRGEIRLREANEALESKVQERTREILELEAVLRQAQKSEAIGQLSGGIAHDFNNLLGSIGASLQTLVQRLRVGQSDDAERYIGMAQEAVQRAASLTQRLLAFSRRQTLDPRPLDVNRLVAGMEEMIRRSMGPAVQVDVRHGSGLWPTLVDGSQLENALLNLCINARDAMAPGGGLLTIETDNRVLDAQAAAERDLPAGDYVAVCVADSGAGMAPETLARIFDPFFTTKPMGQGTGLGLSMVYGFVRQSGGQVHARSTLGQGTQVCLFLPRHLGTLDPDDDRVGPAGMPAPAVPAAGQTILLVEDEATIRTLVAELLEDLGYRVLTASDGVSALGIVQSDQPIDLLLSDVGLPGGLNGRQVADAARERRVGLKVLFITGYVENAALGNGVLPAGMAVLTKPFDMGVLADKVQAMLGNGEPSSLVAKLSPA